MTTRFQVLQGDCREEMKALAAGSVDSVVCDPPYELGFMGKGWDRSGIAYDVSVWSECLRVLKPGGHLLAFGGSRTGLKERRTEICHTVSQAMSALSRKKPMDWSRDTPAINEAEALLDGAMYDFVQGSATREAVKKAYKGWADLHVVEKGKD